VLILDNCRIHHGEEIRKLVEDDAGTFTVPFIRRCDLYFWIYSGCKLIFLPPYSPDYNPIEQAFSSIKSFLQRHCQDTTLGVMDRACQNITSNKAAGYFRASGYTV
jgi:transposase